MKTDKSHDDKDIRELMVSARLELPFDDFEDSVMEQISREEMMRPVVLQAMRLRWFFFFVGVVCGVLISVLLPAIEGPVFGIPPGVLAAVFQVFFVLLVFLQIDALLSTKSTWLPKT